MGPDLVSGAARARLDVEHDNDALIADRLRGIGNQAGIGDRGRLIATFSIRGR